MTDPKDQIRNAPTGTQGSQQGAQNLSFGDQVTAAAPDLGSFRPGEGPDAAIAFRPDDVLAGRFKVVRFVGRGGMGEVYEAEDLELDERVAVKTARFETSQSAREIERFRREIQLARRVTHANVCRTFDVFRHSFETPSGRTSQVLIVSMEFLFGETLEKRIREGGRLQAAEALPIVEQMCAGLGAAHQVGVIHRDFKSANVMLVQQTAGSGSQQQMLSGHRVVITDFGLAHAEAYQGGTLTKSGDIVGTPSYMSPEQIEAGAITPATDVYALGVVIYEMITGLLPFRADTPLAMVVKRLNEPAPSLRLHAPEIDARWESVVARCLERAPEKRYQNTDEILRELRGRSVPVASANTSPSATGLPGVSTASAVGETVVVPKRSRRWQVIAGIAGAAIVLVLIGVFAMGQHAKSTGQGSAATSTATNTRKSIAILGFQNLSGRKEADPVGNILADSLWSQLDVAEVRFIPPSRVQEMKQNLGVDDMSNDMSKNQLDAINKYLGADVLVSGTYTETGSASNPIIEWNIHLLKSSNGESLGSVAQSGNMADLNDLVVHSGRLVRQQLGVTLSAEEEARMDGSLSSNPDAMRDFSEGREKLRTFDVLAATKLLEKSVDADPAFARAHSALAESWDQLGFETKAAEEAKKALDAKSGLSTEARIQVTAQYYAATRDWTKAIQQYAQLWTQYRDEPEYGLLLANTQIRAGKPKDALTTIQQIRSQSLPPGVRAQTDLAEASAHQGLSEYQQELSTATSAAQTAQSLGTNLLLARARILQCFAQISLGDAAKAQPLCEDAKKINVSAGDELGAARATNDIANAYYYTGNYGAAEPLYQEALSIAQTIGDAYDEAGALNNLANIQSARGDHAAAIKTYEQAISVARERNEAGDAALAEQNMATDLYAEGNKTRGDEMFATALKASRDLGDRSLEARILNNKCGMSLGAGALADARKNCEDSLKIRRELDDRAGIGKTLASFGYVEFEQGDLDGARQSLEESLAELSAVNAENDAAYVRNSLAQVALEQNRTADAEKYARDAATELAAEKDASGEAESHGVLARIMVATGRLPDARTESDLATRLAAQSGDESTKLDVAIAGSLVDAKSGNAEGAMKTLAAMQKEAQTHGLIETGFETRLALGEIEMAGGKKGEGRATLQQLARDAKTRGYLLTARKASAGQT
jgi:eukaryotic-like serine/threonine-protein kinase